MRVFSQVTEGPARVVYIAPLQQLATERLVDWTLKFGKKLGKTVVQLTGDNTTDLKLLYVALACGLLASAVLVACASLGAFFL